MLWRQGIGSAHPLSLLFLMSVLGQNIFPLLLLIDSLFSFGDHINFIQFH